MEGEAVPGAMISPLAGKPAPKEILVDLARLERDYYQRVPDMENAAQRVSLAPAATGGRLCRVLLPRPISSPSPRPSATTVNSRAPTVPSIWARTPMLIRTGRA